MEKFERNGTTFTTFVLNDERYLCTGNPTGELKFDFTGEIYDYCTAFSRLMFSFILLYMSFADGAVSFLHQLD